MSKRGKRPNSGKQQTRRKHGGKNEGVTQNQHPHQNRRTYVSNNLLGHVVQVQVADGSWYQGIFNSPQNKGLYSFTLRFARKMEKEGDNMIPTQEIISKLVISPDNFVQMIAKDITFVEDMPDSSFISQEGFKTDSAISKAGDIKERELQRWTPDSDVPEPSWAPTSNSAQNWDQFSTNEKLFGVKTSFNEDIYTTKLDKTSDFYKKNESRAEKLANEITRESSSNVHQASDRGIDMEVDEETLYGAVIRDKDSNDSGRYIPPQKREKMREKRSSSSVTITEKKPTTTTTTTQPESAVKPTSSTPSPTKPATSPASKPSSSSEASKLIKDLFCDAMERRLYVDPSKVDPHWRSTGGSYMSLDEEYQQQYPAAYPGSAYPAPMAPMAYGYGVPPQMSPYGYPQVMPMPGYNYAMPMNYGPQDYYPK